jgi:hypothetical protein
VCKAVDEPGVVVGKSVDGDESAGQKLEDLHRVMCESKFNLLKS